MITVYSVYNKEDQSDFFNLLENLKEVPKSSVILAIVIEDQKEDVFGRNRAEILASDLDATGFFTKQNNEKTYHFIYSYEAELKVWVKFSLFKLKKLARKIKGS